jgi:hypothetical protein
METYKIGDKQLKYWLENGQYKGLLLKNNDIIGKYSGPLSLFEEFITELRKKPLSKNKVFISKKKPFKYEYMFSDWERFKEIMFKNKIIFVRRVWFIDKFVDSFHNFDDNFKPLFDKYVSKYGYFAFNIYSYSMTFYTDLKL